MREIIDQLIKLANEVNDLIDLYSNADKWSHYAKYFWTNQSSEFITARVHLEFLTDDLDLVPWRLHEWAKKQLLNRIPCPILRMAFDTDNFNIFSDKFCPAWQTLDPTQDVQFRFDWYGMYKCLMKYSGKTKYSGDFDKYYRTRGPALLKDKWKKEFEGAEPTPDYHISIKPRSFIVTSEIMAVLEELQLEHPDNYWPLTTTLVNSAVARTEPTYPLLSHIDILKLDLVSSYILNYDARRQFLRQFLSKFFVYTADDIRKWRARIERECPEYRKYLFEGDALRRIARDKN